MLTDLRTPLQDWPTVTESVLRGGAQLIQLREKTLTDEEIFDTAQIIKQLCDQFNVPLIINDRVTLAKKLDADGVHIGHMDQSIEAVRSFLGNRKIIGVSCYNQLPLALSAQSRGANYVAFGSVFLSSTKPGAVQVSIQTIRTAIDRLCIPVCAIGGINEANAASLTEQGIPLLAVSHAVFNASQPETTARQISQLWST